MADLRLDFRLPETLPSTLPVLPLRRGVLFPGTVNLFTVGRAGSRAAVEAAKGKWILVAAQREPVEDPSAADLLGVATLARVLELQRPGPNTLAVLVQGLMRVDLTGFPSSSPYLEAAFSRVSEGWPDDIEAEALLRALRDETEKLATLANQGDRAGSLMRQLRDPPLVIDAVAAMLDTEEGWKKEILQTKSPVVRIRRVLEQVERNLGVREAQSAIHTRLETEQKDAQRDHVLRRQLKAIQDELGEGADDELGRLKAKLKEAGLPEEVQTTVDRELSRLERTGGQGPERGVAMDWLGWIAELPWKKTTGVDVDLLALEAKLDASHTGLGDVKRQVVEHLAVRKLAGHGRADVMLLVGPPGVGKTSIGQAIADATGRKLVRVALGGLRDEAELRGHRRTYVGARPGRLVEGLRRAGTADPVVLLDEIDKLGKGWHGDPGAALLEILDPEQNHAFTDHYLEGPFDLSKVLFIATANDLSQVPGPLRDRMEVVDIAGYSVDEKVKIARSHLLGKLAENAGVAEGDVVMDDTVIRAAIEGWTREAGVRQLQRTLGRLYRGAAVRKAKGELDGQALVVEVDDLPTWLGRVKFRDEVHEAPARPGIATGLAWTPVGGDVLYVEASTLPGRGQLILTGQLGDVMKESARAALTYAMSRFDELGIDPKILETRDVHVHVPAGAVPKDGPSAGVTMFTAIASLLTGRAVRPGLAMTGEATLRGRVLPVGGIKSKVLAAHRQGLRTVILPRKNEGDLDEVPAEVREVLTVHFVDEMDEVLRLALVDG